MKLIDLDGHFLKYVDERSRDIVKNLSEADGVMFQCPKCAEGKKVEEETKEDGGVRRFVRGAHYVLCWFRGKVPDDTDPKPGRWTPQGTGLEDLTFVPGTPPTAVSVLMTSPNGCGWHGHIVKGDAT